MIQGRLYTSQKNISQDTTGNKDKNIRTLAIVIAFIAAFVFFFKIVFF